MNRTTYIEFVHDDATGLFKRSTRSDTITPTAVIYAPEPNRTTLRSLLRCATIVVRNIADLNHHASQPGAVLFVDSRLLHELLPMPQAPVVALVDAPAPELSRIVDLLVQYPRVTHYYVTTGMLAKPAAKTHLERLVSRLALGRQPTMMLSDTGVGKIALLADASRREARFERMREFFEKRGLGARVISRIHDVFEELVTNALYDAPVEAGYFDRARSRTEEVVLPLDRACQITYGLEGETAIVRVRDPFGALGFKRLLAVLDRCNRSEAELDESRGGAGLGMWRVFSLASTVEITVVPGKLTEIVIGIETSGRGKQLLAVNLHFAPDAGCDASVLETIDEDRDLLDRSITLIRVA